jgi:shikimate dehydrogenase
MKVEYMQVNDATINDEILKTLPQGSLVVNASGMGKDRPGSPLTDEAVFPLHGYAWDFNYRGGPDFLCQAERQKRSANLTIENVWKYFIHGWTKGIGEALRIDFSPQDIGRLSSIAAESRS